MPLKNIKQREVIEVSFNQKMLLQGGEYLLSLGCTKYENDGLKVFHRLYDITSVDVISKKDSVGIFDSCSKVELIKR